jgi:hypothetical protein
MSDYTFELDENAETEFYDIVNYYKQINPHLSSDFIQEFDQAVKWLMDSRNRVLLICMAQDGFFLSDFPMLLFIRFTKIRI